MTTEQSNPDLNESTSKDLSETQAQPPQTPSNQRRKGSRDSKSESSRKSSGASDVKSTPARSAPGKNSDTLPTRRKSSRREKQESPSNAASTKKKSSSGPSKLCVDFSSVKKDKNSLVVDENTMNSDNSDSNTLYHDVDWEETLENDAQMDDFAPRRRAEKFDNEVEKCDASEEILDPPTLGFSLYKPGDKVKVHNYTTSTWDEGVVEDVDDLEQEALVVVNNTKEWVSIDSHRISKIGDTEAADGRSLSSIVGGPSVPMSFESIIEQVRREEEAAQNEPKSKIRKNVSMMRKGSRDNVSHKTRALDKLRRRKVVIKRKETGSHVPYSRFKENEKVLAKWSNYRMRRFPAVIKAVMPNKEYEVLFYDGFVKTISEENICKATEEELVKYEGTDPSKADNFVELEEDSKEARRERKKKIFDDYFSAKDLERPRRKFPAGSEVMRLIQQKRSTRMKRLQTKIGLPKRRTKPKRPMEEPVVSVEVDQPGPVELPKEEIKPDPSEPLDEQLEPLANLETPIVPSVDPLAPVPDASIVPKSEIEAPAADLVSKQNPEPSPCTAIPETLSPVKQEPKVEMPVELENSTSSILGESTPLNAVASPLAAAPSPTVQPPSLPLPTSSKPLPDYGDRFKCDIPEGAVPILIKTKDGRAHKSVIIGDKNLLPKWSKHAVTIRGKIQVFLISPEGYKLNSRLDLHDFYMRSMHTSPPPVLDFAIDASVIPTLMQIQDKMDVTPVRFPTWKVNKGRKRLTTSRKSRFTQYKGKTPGQPKLPSSPRPSTRVRTILPRYRYEPIPLEPEPEKEWKCPKDGCDKKFRKESLLQMHIKHYHVEFKALVGAAPNVVDLALARSESNFVESLRPQLMPTKKHSHKMPAPPIPGETGIDPADLVGLPGSSSPRVTPSPSSLSNSDIFQLGPKKFPVSSEKKKSTIKTLLPTRPPAIESSSSVTFDSDDLDSEHDFILSQKHRAKKMKYNGPGLDLGTDHHGFPLSPSFKYTKKKQPPALEKLQITTDGSDSYNTEEEKGSPVEMTEEGVVIERLKSEEIINCVCGFREEDGLMIQCDICLCWQHGICSNIQSDVEVPERYVCYICRHPYRVRSSCKYNYAVHYLTQGKLPTLSFRSKDERVIRERESMMKKCFNLSSTLHHMGHVEQSLAVKLKIAEQQNHPKLYLWAKNWRNSSNKKHTDSRTTAPEPEAPIDPEDCRERLVKEVEADLQQLDERLSTITNQVSCLEAQAYPAGQSDSNISTRTMKQTIQMLMRDLKDVEKFAAIVQQ